MRPFAEADRAASRLEALLAEQHVALRTGQLETLGAIGPRLERAMGLLTPGVPPQQLARLREMAAENARLIRAALSGIAEVRSLRTGAQGTRLSTYDASGRLSSQAAIGQTLGAPLGLTVSWENVADFRGMRSKRPGDLAACSRIIPMVGPAPLRVAWHRQGAAGVRMTIGRVGTDPMTLGAKSAPIH